MLTHVIFAGGTSCAEFDGTSTTPTVEYARGSDYGGGVGGILYTLRSGIASYTHENRRGDVVAKTDDSGSLTFQDQYDGEGEQVATVGSTLDRQKDNSKDTDPWGGINDGMRYTVIENGVRLFLTRDPAGFVDGPNLYTYVVQNPWTHFDPEGLKFDDQQFDSSTNHMKKRVLNETEVNGKKYPTGNYQQYQRDKAYNEQVDKFNDALDKMRSTPSGSAQYDKLKASKQTVEIQLYDGPNVSHVDRGTTTLNWNVREGVAAGEQFSILSHEFFHVQQNINLMGPDAPVQPNPSKAVGVSMDEYQKSRSQQETDFYKSQAKVAAGGSGAYDDRDDYTHQFGGKNYWNEQQAVRMQNTVSAEYHIANDGPGTTSQSLQQGGFVRPMYSNVEDYHATGGASLNGHL